MSDCQCPNYYRHMFTSKLHFRKCHAVSSAVCTRDVRTFVPRNLPVSLPSRKVWTQVALPIGYLLLHYCYIRFIPRAEIYNYLCFQWNRTASDLTTYVVRQVYRIRCSQNESQIDYTTNDWQTQTHGRQRKRAKWNLPVTLMTAAAAAGTGDCWCFSSLANQPAANPPPNMSRAMTKTMTTRTLRRQRLQYTPEYAQQQQQQPRSVVVGVLVVGDRCISFVSPLLKLSGRLFQNIKHHFHNDLLLL